MNKIILYGVIVLLCFTFIYNLFSCCMKESYMVFNIKNISYDLNEEYFSSEKYSFARIDNVVIIPEIKAINHNEYIIYVSAYSKNGTENVQIKNVILKDSGNVWLDHELCEEIQFIKNDESLYEGWLDVGTFTEDNKKKIENGDKLSLLVEVEVIKNDDTYLENMTFDIVVKGYKSLVLHT